MSENEKMNFSLGLIIAPILLSVYGQLVIKWRVNQSGALPVELAKKTMFFVRLLLDPWIISVMVGGVIAALTWFAAMTKYELSYAYPFVSLAFVLVLILSAIFFHETVTVPKVLGVVLVTAGLIIGSQG
jgi:drug/metabolite transporter (DMT)-like permease